MSATTRERYARRRHSEANKLSQQRATAWSDSEDDSPLQMEDGQTDKQPSDVDSQISSRAPDASEGQAAERLVERPATPAAIPMEDLLAITQALKLTNTGPRTEIRPPSFNGEGDLSLFLKQFDDVADANQWMLVQRTLHLRSRLTGDAQGCGHGDS